MATNQDHNAVESGINGNGTTSQDFEKATQGMSQQEKQKAAAAAAATNAQQRAAALKAMQEQQTQATEAEKQHAAAG